MRVAVNDFFLAEQLALVRQGFQYFNIYFAVFTLFFHGDVVHGIALRCYPISDFGHKLAVHHDVHDRLHVQLFTKLHVVLTKARSNMHDACAVDLSNKVSSNDTESVFMVFEKRKQRLVRCVNKIFSCECINNGKRPVFHDRGNQWFAYYIFLTLAFHEDVLHIRLHGEQHIARQGPRRRRPHNHLGASKLTARKCRGYEYRDIRDVEIPLSNFKIRKRRLAARANMHRLASLVDKPLIPQALEHPPLGFHVRKVHGLVGVLHVHPTAKAANNPLPFRNVRKHGCAASFVKLVDAVMFDVFL